MTCADTVHVLFGSVLSVEVLSAVAAGRAECGTLCNLKVRLFSLAYRSRKTNGKSSSSKVKFFHKAWTGLMQLLGYGRMIGRIVFDNSISRHAGKNLSG